MLNRKIGDSLTLFAEQAGPAAVTMWLVIGKEWAALIDAGFGLTGTLRKLVESVTDKPVVHLVTHCDPDHAGGSALFDDIRMSESDARLMPVSLDFEKRVSDMAKVLPKKWMKLPVTLYLRGHMVRAESFPFRDIRDGDLFDLGGIQLEAFAFPGHTKGSMCFINRAEGYVVTGDAIVTMNAAVLDGDRCPPLSVWRASLARFLHEGLDRLTIYAGHLLEPVDSSLPARLLAACDAILAGETSDDVPYVSPFGNGSTAMEHRSCGAVIRYRPENL